MQVATATLSSLSYYSQSKPVITPKKNKENSETYELRTWSHRIHLDEDGVVIPGMAFRNCLAEASRFLSIQIKGKGKATYTKHFEAGIIVSSDIPIYTFDGERIQPLSEQGLLKTKGKFTELEEEEVKALKDWQKPPNEMWGDWIFTPSDGTPGSGKRVWRCYPMVTEWTCKVDFLVTDDTITEPVFKKVLEAAGMLIGIGRFRVRNRGKYGRFQVDDLKWAEV